MKQQNGKVMSSDDVTPSNQTNHAAPGAPSPARLDTEVREKPTRRRFAAKYKQRVLSETEGLPAGEIGAYLRREGLYSSHLSQWRRQREEGALAALEPRKKGPQASPVEQRLARRVADLEREKERLVERLTRADLIIDVQKKLLTLCESTVSLTR